MMQKNDVLQNISLEKLVSLLKNPVPEISLLIRRMQVIRLIDQKQYTVTLQRLPYMVCGIFQPPYRSVENFGYIQFFMVDINHIAEKQLSIDVIRRQMIQDPRVWVCFTSPDEDSLNVLFCLKDKCYDAGQYSLFYRSFVRSLSTQYLLDQVVDNYCADVTKICFLSEDIDVYYNPKAELIEINSFVNFENSLETHELKSLIDKETKELYPQKKNTLSVPDDIAIAFIKERLRPKSSTRPQIPTYVPQEVEQLLEKLVDYIKEAGIEVSEVIDIQYGKKLKFRLGVKQAEINLFWGKRGFSAVKSPRKGTSPEFNDLMQQYISSFIGGLYDI
ncbi:MAG: virulence protein E [Tannerellaceae bacterium]|jgi:hypothetical protein|nr:virulence protein E [Tannerellaceae bacterium]